MAKIKVQSWNRKEYHWKNWQNLNKAWNLVNSKVTISVS